MPVRIKIAHTGAFTPEMIGELNLIESVKGVTRRVALSAEGQCREAEDERKLGHDSIYSRKSQVVKGERGSGASGAARRIALDGACIVAWPHLKRLSI